MAPPGRALAARGSKGSLGVPAIKSTQQQRQKLRRRASEARTSSPNKKRLCVDSAVAALIAGVSGKAVRSATSRRAGADIKMRAAAAGMATATRNRRRIAPGAWHEIA